MLLRFLTAEDQFIDLLVGPEFRFIKRDAALVLSAQAKRRFGVVIDVADIADAHKPRDVLQRLLVSADDGFLWHVMPTTIHTGLHPCYIQIEVTSKDKVAADEIALILLSLARCSRSSLSGRERTVSKVKVVP